MQFGSKKSSAIDAAIRPQSVTPPPAATKNRRRTLLIAVGVIIAALASLGFVVLNQRSGQRTEVVVVARDVPFGATITRADLTSARIAVDPSIDSVAWSEVTSLVGQTATTTLFKGALVTGRSLTPSALPGDGKAIVGIRATAGHYPEGLIKPGSLVLLVSDSGPSSGPTPATKGYSGSAVAIDATVVSIGELDGQGAITINVVVKESVATTIAGPAASGQIIVILRSGK